jgi:hypothetical protein
MGKQVKCILIPAAGGEPKRITSSKDRVLQDMRGR